jgi:hypothetical protein
MAYKFGRIALSVLLLASVSAGTAQGANLLGINIGGGSGVDAEVSIGGGSTGGGGSGGGSSGNNLVDVDLLGGDSNLADVNIGGGAVEADVNLLGDSLLDASLIADLGLEVDIGIGIGGGIGGDSGSGNVTSGSGNFLVACSLQDGRRVLTLAAQTSVTPGAIASWQRSANVRIVPVKLCTATRSQVAQLLRSSEKVMVLRSAVDRDSLISASLDRTSYRSSNVFAVDRSGEQLTVYVF